VALVSLTALVACRSAAPGSTTNATRPATCRPDTAVESRLQRVVDSAFAARPDARGIALHVIAPARCLDRSFVAGVADPATRAPVVAATPVRIASNTKTYVAAAVLRLVEDGRVGLDDPIERHVSAEHVALLREGGHDPAAITVRHLLSHTAGLPDHAQDDEGFLHVIVRDPSRRWTRTDQIRLMVTRGRRLSAPGTAFSYSDTGYLLLGELLERVTGQTMAAALRSLLAYDRLGLSSTWLETVEPVPAGVAPRAHQFAGPIDTHDWSPTIDLYGGGGLDATARDMAHFTRAVYTGAVFRRPATLALLESSPVVQPPTSRMLYGIGTIRRTIDGTRILGHSGYWGTTSLHAPERDVTVAAYVLQNATFRPVTTVLEREALVAVRGAAAGGAP
jgi:D-alanyl-D-alanine carboxypeptidase